MPRTASAARPGLRNDACEPRRVVYLARIRRVDAGRRPSYCFAMSIKHSGSCLCGAVRFEIEGDFEHFYLCHCEHCRKDTGSAHAANLFTSTAALRWLSGQDRVTVFNLPNTRHRHCFCSTCGSALPDLQMSGALLKVPAGSLDTEVSLRPEAHLFFSSRANWDDGLENIQKVARLP
jgi:hypothetical protein